MNPEKDGEWINLKPFPYNDKSYSIEHPHLSADKKTLYFASNMPLAIGGYDIFKVKINDDGTYSKPERLKGSVNTALDEKFPQLSPDQNLLYFSSNAHKTIGGYDIYRSRKTPYGFATLLNLGNTINSKKDELSYIPVNDSIGYLTSNRPKGLGKFDVYKVIERTTNHFTTGIIIDEQTLKPLAGAEVVLLDEFGTKIGTVITGDDGSFKFDLDAFLNYTIVSTKEGYKRTVIDINTFSNKEQQEQILKLTPKFVPKPIEAKAPVNLVIENIYFKFNSASLTRKAMKKLSRIISLLNENSETSLNIKAYTDQEGSDDFNLNLSDRRAQSTYNYLINNGIEASRLTKSSFGESNPVLNCLKCSRKENQINRRVEFSILQ